MTNTYLISPFFPFSDETIDILKQIENSLAGPTTSPANNRQMAKRDIREFPDTRELLELLNRIHQKLLAWSCTSLNNFVSLKKSWFSIVYETIEHSFWSHSWWNFLSNSGRFTVFFWLIQWTILSFHVSTLNLMIFLNKLAETEFQFNWELSWM